MEWLEKKKKVLKEMARVMLHMHDTPIQFWVEAINTTCYIVNRVFLMPWTKKTYYELLIGRKPNLKCFRTFDSECYILKDMDSLGKFDSKSDIGIFLISLFH